MSDNRISQRDIQAFLSVSAEYLGVYEEQPVSGNVLKTPDMGMDIQYSHLFSRTRCNGGICYA